MNKILILCYFFPPNTQIGSWRPYSWAKNFHLYGLQPTIITRYWTGNEISREDLIQEVDTPIITENNKDFRLIRLPYKKSFLENICITIGLKKIYFRINFLLGNLHGEFNGYRCFKKFVYQHLKKEKYDIILSTQAPINLAKLTYQINKKFNIPYMLDFRDLYNNGVLNKNYKLSFKEKISIKVVEFYLRKWLKKASLITAVSEPLIHNLQNITQNNNHYATIYNGYEMDMYEKKENEEKNKKFTITILGSLYLGQNINLMIDGFKKFIENKNPEKIIIQFIGAKLNKTAQEIEKSLPLSNIIITERINRNMAIEKVVCSDILFYIGWKGFKGVVSGKIFEYLGARKNILLAPSDEDILEKIIKETNSGKVANSVEELIDILNNWYKEWEMHGKLEYYGIEEKISFYSRETQAEILATKIKDIFF